MTDSKLKLNADNSEFLIISTPLQRSKLDGHFSDMYPESKLHTCDKVLFQFLSYRRSGPHLPIYVSLSRKSIAILLLVVDLITVIPSIIIVSVETLLNFNASRIVWQG